MRLAVADFNDDFPFGINRSLRGASPVPN